MVEMDLCDIKKFPDLEDDFVVHFDKKNKMSFMDEKNNVWTEERKLGEGSHGKVIEFKSHNKDYTDLAIKFFTSDDDEIDLDIQEETDAVNFLNLYRCKNFIRAGVKELNNKETIIIMESIDGDLTQFDFSQYENPQKVYDMIVKFIVSSYECLMKKGKLYADIKEENIGFKLCNKYPKFTFLDFGSVFDEDSSSIVVTYNINTDLYRRNYFSNDLLVIFSIIITLLSIKLSTINKKYRKNFDIFMEDLQTNFDYPKIYLLDVTYVSLIKKRFFKYFKEEDIFIKLLFEILDLLTDDEITLRQFIAKIKY